MQPTDSSSHWMNNESLLLQVAQNFKLLEAENRQLKAKLAVKSDLPPSRDQLKILKLYSYSEWTDYMAWVDEKLEESGETLDDNEQTEIKRVLS